MSMSKQKVVVQNTAPEQQHLGFEEAVNLGSFYTPPHLVDAAYAMLAQHIKHVADYTILDTSCGYGSFLRSKNGSHNSGSSKTIGGDIDSIALQQAAALNTSAHVCNQNGLVRVMRNKYAIAQDEKLIIVGNPPYNDTTSIIRRAVKHGGSVTDADLRARDLGLSFLLSYNKLHADYVCVLHPLSYLIKKTNFRILSPFAKNYRLLDSVVVSSGEFAQASKTTQFPIILALYERVHSRNHVEQSQFGMDYDFIENYRFKTIDGKSWSLSRMTAISRYIAKYPNKERVSLEDAMAFFWTMRDINALKRTKTFIATESTNTLRVTQDDFAYYCYVDIFKDYIKHLPYYFGNCNVFIASLEFERVKREFVQAACAKHRFLAKYAHAARAPYAPKLDAYFRELLGVHYVD
ncbi:MAG: hypothetical protein Ta2A_24130 [Treponemataceae bacterium]|nr:MAG: hypothetical protein Ta2A_24130 [Treponemataceae bacterium]